MSAAEYPRLNEAAAAFLESGYDYRVCIHTQWFVRIRGAVKPQFTAKRHHACLYGVKFTDTPHREVQVQLLRYIVVRPRRS